MLREFDLQRMHWADKTQSMLHQRQMEACETRLLSYPTESIFTLQDGGNALTTRRNRQNRLCCTHCGRCGRMCLRACPWKPRC